MKNESQVKQGGVWIQKGPGDQGEEQRKGSMQEPGIKARIHTVEALTMREKQPAVQKTNFLSAIILLGTISNPCPLLWRS